MSVLKAEIRELSSKPKRLRSMGIIPACVYGSNIKETILIQIKQRDLLNVLKTKSKGSKVSLDVAGKEYNVLIKDISFNLLDNQIQHMDLQTLIADEFVSSTTSIELINKENVEGIIQQSLSEIPIKAYPIDLVEKVVIDLNGMKVGDDVKVSDIKELKKDSVEILIDPESLVLSIFESKKPVIKDEDEEDEQSDIAE